MYVDKGHRYSDVDLALVYDHLAFSEYKLGNIKKATQYTRDLLQNGQLLIPFQFRVTLSDNILEPDHERALSNMAYFEKIRTEQPDLFADVEEVEEQTEMLTERQIYEATCREGKPLVSKVAYFLFISCFVPAAFI